MEQLTATLVPITTDTVTALAQIEQTATAKVLPAETVFTEQMWLTATANAPIGAPATETARAEALATETAEVEALQTAAAVYDLTATAQAQTTPTPPTIASPAPSDLVPQPTATPR